MRETVKAVVNKAIDKSGKAAALASQLHDMGIRRPNGKSYNFRTISGWGRNGKGIPADVFLTVALISGTSIDAQLFGEASFAERLARVEQGLVEIREELRVRPKDGRRG